MPKRDIFTNHARRRIDHGGANTPTTIHETTPHYNGFNRLQKSAPTIKYQQFTRHRSTALRQGLRRA